MRKMTIEEHYMKEAIRQAKKTVECNLVENITSGIAQYGSEDQEK